jgi:hypothetical protein
MKYRGWLINNDQMAGESRNQKQQGETNSGKSQSGSNYSLRDGEEYPSGSDDL